MRHRIEDLKSSHCFLYIQAMRSPLSVHSVLRKLKGLSLTLRYIFGGVDFQANQYV